MENQHREIKGYRELSADEIAAMNEVKQKGVELGALVEKLRGSKDLDQRWVSIGATDLQTGLMALTRAIAKPTFFVFALCILAACAPHSEMIQHGNEKILFTQTQNVWADNVLLTTPCKPLLRNGACDPDGPTQMTTATGKGAGVLGGVGGGVVSALIIRDGLTKSKSNISQKNQTDIRASTVNPK